MVFMVIAIVIIISVIVVVIIISNFNVDEILVLPPPQT